jgi:Tol biopolymer transport system component
MSDLKTRFRGTERIPTPDLWPAISNRDPRPIRPEPSPARRVLVAAFALALAIAGLAFVARTFEGRESPQPTAPAAPTNGVIAYRSIGTTEGVFRTVLPDGSDPREVHVDVPGFVGVPSWSPDGTRIAFDVNSFDEPHPESGYFDIYIANADGSDSTRLTFDKNDHSPVWSPDGTKIAFVLGIGDVEQIGVMNADGSNPHQLTETEGLNTAPSWSPDGTKISFVSWDGSNSDIYVMDADGSNVQRITDDPTHEDQPVWSPDGRLIAFSRIALSSADSSDNGIFTMAPDGTGITKLLHVPDPANVSFAWSPDGTEMVVVTITGPEHDRIVAVLDLATGILTPITEPGAWEGASWQPAPQAVSERTNVTFEASPS